MWLADTMAPGMSVTGDPVTGWCAGGRGVSGGVAPAGTDAASTSSCRSGGGVGPLPTGPAGDGSAAFPSAAPALAGGADAPVVITPETCGGSDEAGGAGAGGAPDELTSAVGLAVAGSAPRGTAQWAGGVRPTFPPRLAPQPQAQLSGAGAQAIAGSGRVGAGMAMTCPASAGDGSPATLTVDVLAGGLTAGEPETVVLEAVAGVPSADGVGAGRPTAPAGLVPPGGLTPPRPGSLGTGLTRQVAGTLTVPCTVCTGTAVGGGGCGGGGPGSVTAG